MADGADSVAGILESILRQRRSCRAFAPEEPARELVERVLEAGMFAPYAALAYGGRTDFRRFFVFGSQSAALAELREIAQSQAGRMADQMAGRAEQTEKTATFVARLRQFRLPESPCLVVVAELNGTPPVMAQSLAHCLQNMWLMATALGLGLQLLSVFESMGANAQLCALLGVQPGEWSFNACALGYPAAPLAAATRADTRTLTRWMP
jgi:nitroreductase